MFESVTTAPVPAREFVVNPRVQANGQRLIAWLIATIILVFAVTNLERVSGSTAVQHLSEQLCLWTMDDKRIFHGQVWRLVTHLWLHRDLKHLTNNLGSLLIYWWVVSQYYSTRAWFGTYIAAGVLAGIGYIAFPALWHADFNQWHGSLSDCLVPDDRTLKGASGAIFGLLGMIIAASVRLFLMRKHQIVEILKSGPLFAMSLLVRSYMRLEFVDPPNAKKHDVIESSKFGPPFLISILAVMFLCGMANPTTSALTHLIGVVVGFVAGMILPMKVGMFVFGNQANLVKVEATEHWLKGLRWMKMTLNSSFNHSTDVLILDQLFIDYRLRLRVSSRKVLAGNESMLGDKPVLIACSTGLPFKDDI